MVSFSFRNLPKRNFDDYNICGKKRQGFLIKTCPLDSPKKMCYTAPVIKLQIYEMRKGVINMEKSNMTVLYKRISDIVLIAKFYRL